MNLTNEQKSAIVSYLNAERKLSKHLAGAKVGYNTKLALAVKTEVENLKKLFAVDEVEFLTSAAFRDDLINKFID